MANSLGATCPSCGYGSRHGRSSPLVQQSQLGAAHWPRLRRESNRQLPRCCSDDLRPHVLPQRLQPWSWLTCRIPSAVRYVHCALRSAVNNLVAVRLGMCSLRTACRARRLTMCSSRPPRKLLVSSTPSRGGGNDGAKVWMTLASASLLIWRVWDPFEPADECPWLADVGRDSHSLPEPYRALVRRFRWASFEVNGFEAFSNVGNGSGYDISDAPFKDPGLVEWLIPRGLLQIGRPDFANYDPVCIDTRSGGREPTIVRVDHEDVLCCRKQVRVTKIAESFQALVLGGVV